MKGTYIPWSPTAATAKQLVVREVVSSRDVQVECPNIGETRQSFLSEPEKQVCSLCGAEFTGEGPFDHRDPHWRYTHPQGAQRLIEAHVIVLVPANTV